MREQNRLAHWPERLELIAVGVSERGDVNNPPQSEPISLTSVWRMASPESANAALTSETDAFSYRRIGHPNERSLANKLACLHSAIRAIVTAQGMSSTAAIAHTVLRPGAVAWIGNELYGESNQLFQDNFSRWQVDVHLFDPTDSKQVAELGNAKTDLVLVETMSNPRLRVPKLAELSAATHRSGGLLVVDNTFATHLLCRPLLHGADLVVESLGKQINGHSDSMLGLIAGTDAGLMERVANTVGVLGLASSPMDCYLTSRGLMSLAVRMERACNNAFALAEALTQINSVHIVDYPGLEVHPQHQVATAQFSGGYGWMLSFSIDAQRDSVVRLFEALRPDIQFVPSLGDVSTTVSHPASTSHRGLTDAQRNDLGIGDGTIRVSCGIEPTDWLVERFSSVVKSLGELASGERRT